MNVIRGTLIVAALCSAGAAFAADPSSADPAKDQFDAERARCMSGSTGQDQASCLRSAGAAYESIRLNKLHNPNTAYRENALARCRALPASDQADCISRVDGDGMQSGSVKGGGDIKETVTTVPVSPASSK